MEKEITIMAKYVCTVCGYVHEGDSAPESCPQCKAPAEKFKVQEGERTWAAEHVIGVAQGASEDIMADLRMNFEGECTEVGMYLGMARLLIVRVIRKSVYTGRRLLLRRLSMLPSSLSD